MLIKWVKMIVDFICNGGPDNRGRTLEQMMEWSDDRLERCHDYIQWMFPLDEPSMFNPYAPILTCDEILELRQYGESILHSARMFLQFLIRGKSPHTKQFWLVPNNHNHMRISRIIKCLKIIDFPACAESFHDWAVKQNKNGTLDAALRHWEDALFHIPNLSRPTHDINPYW